MYTPHEEPCMIENGTHTKTYFRDQISGLVVCSRHRDAHEQKATPNQFLWEPVE